MSNFNTTTISEMNEAVMKFCMAADNLDRTQENAGNNGAKQFFHGRPSKIFNEFRLVIQSLQAACLVLSCLCDAVCVEKVP